MKKSVSHGMSRSSSISLWSAAFASFTDFLICSSPPNASSLQSLWVLDFGLRAKRIQARGDVLDEVGWSLNLFVYRSKLPLSDEYDKQFLFIGHSSLYLEFYFCFDWRLMQKIHHSIKLMTWELQNGGLRLAKDLRITREQIQQIVNKP